jgi:hypothetical protein
MEMIQSATMGKLAEALAAYQSGARNPANTARNPFLKNAYAPLNAILAEVRPELAKHGLAVTQLVTGHDKIGVTTLLMHASGEYIGSTVSLSPDSSKGLSVAQNAGVVITYLRRYAVQSILGISGEDDTDGHAEVKPPANPVHRETKPEPKHETKDAPKSDALKKAADLYRAALDRFGNAAPEEVHTVWRERGRTAYMEGDAAGLRAMAAQLDTMMANDEVAG